MAECVPIPYSLNDEDDYLCDDEESPVEIQREMLEKLKAQSKYVKLNVGGALYATTIGTLTKHDNMLRAMFSGRMDVQTDEEGRFMVEWVWLRRGLSFCSALMKGNVVVKMCIYNPGIRAL